MFQLLRMGKTDGIVSGAVSDLRQHRGQTDRCGAEPRHDEPQQRGHHHPRLHARAARLRPDHRGQRLHRDRPRHRHQQSPHQRRGEEDRDRGPTADSGGNVRRHDDGDDGDDVEPK